MRRTFEYLLTMVVVLGIAFLVVKPMVDAVAQSMDDSANMIARAGQ